MSTDNQIQQFFKPNHWETEKSYIGDSWWYGRTLSQVAAKVIEIDLQSLDLSVSPWEMSTIADFVAHSFDVQKCDYEYPIIMSPDGWIMNGWHRVVKALLEDKKTITAHRIVALPQPDGKRETI